MNEHVSVEMQPYEDESFRDYLARCWPEVLTTGQVTSAPGVVARKRDPTVEKYVRTRSFKMAESIWSNEALRRPRPEGHTTT